MRIAFYTQLKKYGNSCIIVIPKDIRTIIEAERGDIIRVEVENVEPNLHVDWTARQDPEARDNGLDQESGYPQMDSCKGDR